MRQMNILLEIGELVVVRPASTGWVGFTGATALVRACFGAIESGYSRCGALEHGIVKECVIAAVVR